MSVPRDVSAGRSPRRLHRLECAELLVIVGLVAASLWALASAYFDATLAIAVLTPLTLGITWWNVSAAKRARRHLHVVRPGAGG